MDALAGEVYRMPQVVLRHQHERSEQNGFERQHHRRQIEGELVEMVRRECVRPNPDGEPHDVKHDERETARGSRNAVIA